MAHNIFKALQKLAGQAATAVQEDERRSQFELASKMVAQQQAQNTPMYTYTATGSTSGAAGAALNTFYPSTSGSYQITAGGSAPGIGNLGQYQAGTIYRSPTPLPSTITFTDEQQASFLAKLGELLTKGWECIRCHRIWSPQVTGCEFCNFIDRLEGKDVERDTAA